jgi:hypothetical protein
MHEKNSPGTLITDKNAAMLIENTGTTGDAFACSNQLDDAAIDNLAQRR